MSGNEKLRINELLRYARPAHPGIRDLDGFRNFHYLTRAPQGLPRVQLEKGINPTATTGPRSDLRRGAVLIRSSPWKAGSLDTPWHDTFDLEAGTAIYYGDHKVDSMRPVGSTPGNKVLLETWALHRSQRPIDRLLAPPLLIFRARPWTDRGVRKEKGVVEFLGPGLITAARRVEQTDTVLSRTFPNYRFDLKLMPLDDRALDWSWINARRQGVPTEQCIELAPSSWRDLARSR